jgi:hypothetical protein
MLSSAFLYQAKGLKNADSYYLFMFFKRPLLHRVSDLWTNPKRPQKGLPNAYLEVLLKPFLIFLLPHPLQDW